jgi:CTP-dependent riboflavin kinase
LVVPEVLDYPDDIIEIVAPANLRDELRLVDGSLVEVEVTV